MHKKINFFIILFVFAFFSLSFVSAGELNCTSVNKMDCNDTVDSISLDDVGLTNISEVRSHSSIEKTKPVISLKTNHVKTKGTLGIYLKNSSGDALKFKNLTISLNNKKYSIFTDSKGIAYLNISLPAKSYRLKVTFAGDGQYRYVSKSFNVEVSKLDTQLTSHANFLLRGQYLYVDLSANKDLLSSKKVSIKINGKTHVKTTNRYGRAAIKIGLAPASYSVKIKFNGDGYYEPSQKKFNLRVTRYTSITIGNTRLLTNGYLRIYLKASEISHKSLTIKIANKKFSVKTDSEGIIVLKPDVWNKTYNVVVKYGKYWTSKKVQGVTGNVKDPLKENISLRNGVPDVDLMPGNYVMGDESATYTLTKAQYREAIQRDSYCLFLNNKLSKYTFFKTKSHPNTYHIIKREKWNVIERAINAKLVKANKYDYWPSYITVSLKGKSYVYSEVRDVQDTSYTCGPASASVCSQVLRNFIPEKYIAYKGGSKKVEGTSCYGIMQGLGENFNCSYFYKDSFDDALKELQKGGCAIIFHTKRHYVAILDISKDGKNVLVSNSYGSYYNIPTKWLTVSYMKTRFIEGRDDSLIVRLNYSLSNSTEYEVNCFYNSMGTNWVRQNIHATIG